MYKKSAFSGHEATYFQGTVHKNITYNNQYYVRAAVRKKALY